MTKPRKSKVFLVDDHPMVRQGLAHFLATAGFTVTGQAGDSQETLAHPALDDCDVLVVDLTLGEESGIELIRTLREGGKKVLVYSMHEGVNLVRHALEAGANGYVTKRESPQTLLDGITRVARGADFRSDHVEEILQESVSLNQLSSQQQQIYGLLGRGYTNEDIAKTLEISIRTLESYCVRIMNKLGIKGIKELRRHAIQEAKGEAPGTPIDL